MVNCHWSRSMHGAPRNAIRSLRPLKIALLIWIVSKSWWIRVILRWLRFPYSKRGNDMLQYVLPWMSIKNLMRDFLWLQNLIISYWSTLCTANCSRTYAITAPDSTFTTLARIRQPWHPGISRFLDTAWPEAWNILHQKRYEYYQDNSKYKHSSLSKFNHLFLMIQLNRKTQLNLNFNVRGNS